MERDSFVFYRSFYEGLSQLWDESQLKIYQAIFSYQFEWVEFELEWIERAMWKLIKPQLDANNKRYSDWCKWWRPKKETIGIKTKKTTGCSKTKTTGFENQKPNENENDNVNDNEKENILSSKEDKEKSSYWDENINECLEIIKKYNWWIIDWTQKEQRIYWKNLIWKLEKIDSVKNWNYTRAQVLQMILEIVSKNSYHSQKISWPKKIYYELWGLMQICKQEISKQKDHSIPFIPWIW